MMCLAVPGKILSVGEAQGILRTAHVGFGGMVKEASLALLPEAAAGEYVLVHAGVAIAVIDEAEAQRVFALLEELEEEVPLQEAEHEIPG